MIYYCYLEDDSTVDSAGDSAVVSAGDSAGDLNVDSVSIKPQKGVEFSAYENVFLNRWVNQTPFIS